MLDSAADAQRQVKLGRHGLARAANLAVHRQPACVADGPRSREFATDRIGELFGEFNIFLFLYPPANRDDDLRLRQVNCLLGFLEPIFRLGANRGRIDAGIYGFKRSGRGAVFNLIAAKRAVLQGNEVGRLASKTDVGSEFPLKHLPHKEQLLALFLIADHIRNQTTAERRGQLRREVAHLVGVRHQHQTRLFAADELLQRGHEGIRSVFGQRRRLERIDFG